MCEGFLVDSDLFGDVTDKGGEDGVVGDQRSLRFTFREGGQEDGKGCRRYGRLWTHHLEYTMEADGTGSSSQLPYLTRAVAGIGGRIRSEPEDFRVDERPLYLPCGNGEHLYLRVTKRLLSTPDLVRRISSTLGVKVQGIGTAGLKDARAVTTQLVSLHGVPEERVVSTET